MNDSVPERARTAPRSIGRYVLFDRIAAGGTATVHYGRLLGPIGFARTVAIKQLFPNFASDPEFVSALSDEARLAARIQHPNVVPVLDVVALEGEIFLVMEYVHGESLSRLLRLARDRGTTVPPRIACAILSHALHGLHAAHEAKSERGEGLDIVHRDVSPQNILVGADGVARVLDFGIAKAKFRSQTTREGQVKGKLAYMAPEQLRGGAITSRTDVYGASAVLWETLTSRQLFRGDHDGDLREQILLGLVDPPSKFVPEIPRALDVLTLKGLEHEPTNRFPSAREMAVALERCLPQALPSEVGEWVTSIARDDLVARAGVLADIENSPSPSPRTSTVPAQPDEHEEGRARDNTSPPKRADRPNAHKWILGALALAMASGVLTLRTRASRSVIDRGVPSVDLPGQAASSVRSTPSVADVASGSESMSTPPPPAPRPHQARSAPPSTAARPRARVADCDPPYTVDSTGALTFKRSCLESR